MSDIAALSYLVGGLLAGAASTAIMTLTEIPSWKRWGLHGVFEWHENQVLYSKFFKPDKSQINFPGIFFLHFVNGGLGGLGFYFLLNFQGAQPTGGKATPTKGGSPAPAKGPAPPPPPPPPAGL